MTIAATVIAVLTAPVLFIRIGLPSRDWWPVETEAGAGVATLEQHFKTLFPGEDIRVSVSDEAVILAGEVSSNNVVLRAGEIAAGAYAKSRVINMLGLPGGTPSQQVMLQVRFAEVNRRAITELGASFVSANRIAARTTTQQFSAPDFDDGDEQLRRGITLA